eukprot:TRINITY_DN2617_c1_g1_i1.p2 TRINITY_DN2617_c1_g1~~TRINITY_DN2617_c1_g1_i1.p2  ORF type:complete len:743 (-),score=197.75 TRINITY_DN2617_c1_g1_i1:3854-6082(-)
MTIAHLSALNQRIHDWMGTYQDLLEKDIAGMLRRHGIQTPDSITRHLADLDAEGRLLQIGVIGRVKAGKSSLLNALIFNGQHVLPRAATPMTAALTTLTYAEHFGAKVQFYSQQDLSNIKADADRYERRLNEERRKLEEQIRLQQMQSGMAQATPVTHQQIDQMAHNALRSEVSLAASYDQWQRILGSTAPASELDEQELKATDMASLAELLLDYVGADGVHMPRTKSVDIFLPLESLRDIRIIDTPGLNDPVRSREERTTHLLGECDVVFIVSPAGQFLSAQDLEVMSRITQKEGVQEIVLIASQVDLQLFGSARKSSLQDSLKGIIGTLSLHMVNTLKRLKERHPEVGATFDSLIEGGGAKLLTTSGMCQSLAAKLEERPKWDKSEQKALDNLQRNYPDFFPDDAPERIRANLLLGNAERMHAVVAEVRRRKDEIIGRRRDEFIQAKIAGLTALRTDLLHYCAARQRELKEANIDDLRGQRAKLEDTVIVGKNDISQVVDAQFRQLQSDLEAKFNGILADERKYIEQAFDNASSEETKSRTENKSGALSWLARKLYGGGKETVFYTVTKVFASQVLSRLREMERDMSRKITNISETETRGFGLRLTKAMTKTAREYLGNDVSPRLLVQAAENAVHQIGLRPVVLESPRLKALQAPRPSLEGSEADLFLEQARDALIDVMDDARKQTHQFTRHLGQLRGTSVGTVFFDEMRERIQTLEQQLQNSEMTMHRLQHMEEALEAT